MVKRDLSFIEGMCAVVILLGTVTGVWVETQEDIVRLEERVENLATINTEFNVTIRDLTVVLQDMSVNMGRVDERLGGVETQLKRLGREAVSSKRTT